MAQVTRLVGALLWCTAGCVSLPNVVITPGSETVRALLLGQVPAADERCSMVAETEASDGRIGAHRAAYNGTAERVIQKLRNAAVESGANVVQIVDSAVPIVIDSPGSTTSEITLRARLLRCSVNADAPNSLGRRNP